MPKFTIVQPRFYVVTFEEKLHESQSDVTLRAKKTLDGPVARIGGDDVIEASLRGWSLEYANANGDRIEYPVGLASVFVGIESVGGRNVTVTLSARLRPMLGNPGHKFYVSGEALLVAGIETDISL